MDKDLIRSLAKAIGGRVKSLLVQAAKDETERALRHFRSRVLDPQPPGADAPAASPARALAPPEPDVSASPPLETAVRQARPAAAPARAVVDLNAASKDELVALAGIGNARAEAIIRGRPFAAPGDLVERKILPASVFEPLKDRIGVA
jgi:hypothetical protein